MNATRDRTCVRCFALCGFFSELQMERWICEQLQSLSAHSVARGPRGHLISWGTLPMLVSLVFPFHYSSKYSPDFHSDFIAQRKRFRYVTFWSVAQAQKSISSDWVPLWILPTPPFRTPHLSPEFFVRRAVVLTVFISKLLDPIGLNFSVLHVVSSSNFKFRILLHLFSIFCSMFIECHCSVSEIYATLSALIGCMEMVISGIMFPNSGKYGRWALGGQHLANPSAWQKWSLIKNRKIADLSSTGNRLGQNGTKNRGEIDWYRQDLTFQRKLNCWQAI